MAKPTNLCVVLLDSLNRHMLGSYGGDEFDTPNLDRFAAEKATRFTDHPHLFETGGENYHTDFRAWDYVRGRSDSTASLGPTTTKTILGTMT